MTTLSLCPSFTRPLTSKLFWIRANRLLAWSLVFAPFVELAGHIRLEYSLPIDLTILLAHGSLSFVLFGKPEIKDRAFAFTMHVMGFRAGSLSERNRFLLSGYRIALAFLAMALIIFVPGELPKFAAFFIFIYPLFRLSLTVAQHVYLACLYSLRRWTWSRERRLASGLALFISAAYMVASFRHVFW